MRKLLITTVLFVFCLGGIAQANGNDKDMDHDADIYVKGSLGIFMPEDSNLEWEGGLGSFKMGEAAFNTGFGLTAAVGRSFGPMDLELEYGYREATGDKLSFIDKFEYAGAEHSFPADELDIKDSLHVKTLMVNAIYNLKNSSSITPYAGAGMGAAWIEAKLPEGAEVSTTKLAYQLMAGVDIEVAKNTSLLLGYRYIGMGDITGPASLQYKDPIFGEITEAGEGSGDMNIHNLEVGLKYSF